MTEEDYMAMLVTAQGQEWAEIGRMIGGRPDQQVRGHFYVMRRHLGYAEKGQAMTDLEAREVATQHLRERCARTHEQAFVAMLNGFLSPAGREVSFD